MLMALAVAGCGGDGGGQVWTSEVSQAEADEQWREQAAAYDRQTVKMDEILERQEFELEQWRVHNEQYANLLAKWEDQTRRVDVILEAVEKKTAVKP
jgi:hypothetical protein